jgi:predicted transcriptional regulator
MAMIDDRDIEHEEIVTRRPADDTTPLVSLVRDQPYTRGGLTSQGRTSSESYAAFVRRAQKEFRDVRK